MVSAASHMHPGSGGGHGAADLRAVYLLGSTLPSGCGRGMPRPYERPVKGPNGSIANFRSVCRGRIVASRRESLPPLGEGGAPARRMRGKCPASTPSSVTCGDSFPQNGEAIFAVSLLGSTLPSGCGRGMPRPYRAAKHNALSPAPTARLFKTCAWSAHTIIFIFYLLSFI